MPRVFLGLGTNVGDRIGFLRAGVGRLRNIETLDIRRFSPIYETEPVGKKDQDPFLNVVVECFSDCDPRNLMPMLKEVERATGRRPRGRWEPRELDLDILYVGDLVITSPEVRVPHPEIPNRRFVLEPLCELAPLFNDPLRGTRLLDLLAVCPGNEQVTRIIDTI